ncbi:MAG: hypothetical protein IH892_15555, partial [Planctomycetes bacterium]|nr:hypothetical protein [Planctomycetota bacterium]
MASKASPTIRLLMLSSRNTLGTWSTTARVMSDVCWGIVTRYVSGERAARDKPVDCQSTHHRDIIGAMSIKMIPAALLLVLMIALPAHAQNSSQGTGYGSYVAGEYRVFTGAGEPASFDDVIAAMGRHRVGFIGET